MKKQSSSRIPTLKRKLWKVFAKYVKIRDKNICFTCGRRVFGYEAHAGHFIPKNAGGLALYFHEDNVHCQCAGCNLFLSGNQYVYGKNLGEEKVKELYALKGRIIKDYPFLEKIAYYTEKVEEMSQIL